MKRKLVKILIVTALVTSVTASYLTPLVYASENGQIIENVSEESVLIENPLEDTGEDLSEVLPIEKEEVVAEESKVKEEVKNEIKENIQQNVEEITKVEETPKVEEVVEKTNKFIPVEAWKGNEKLIYEVCGKTGIDDIAKVTYDDIKKIKMLDLSFNIFEGTENKVPEIIGKFEGLVSLNLSLISGIEVPEFIGNLTNLRELNLQSMGISSLPRSIENLQNLEMLDISGNNFNSVPKEVFNLKNLQYLEIGSNEISDIPSEIGNLDKLISLECNANNIVELPKEIYSLHALRYLGLGRNNMTYISSEISNLKNLEDLVVRNNKLVEIPNEIVNINGDKTIFTLDVTNNQIVNVPKATSRQDIICNNNFLPSTLYNIPYSNELILKTNSISIDKGEVISSSSLKSCVQGFRVISNTKTETFTIDDRHEIEMVLDGRVITPEDIANLEEGSYRVNLKLAAASLDNKCAITKNTLEILVGDTVSKPEEDKPSIEEPDIPENATGEIPVEYWQECTPLMMFVCKYLGVRDIKYVTYEDLQEIKYVDLIGQGLSDLPKILEKFTNLEDIGLFVNNFDKIPEELFKLENLEILSLGRNSFTEIPQEISKLKNLKVLNMSDNMFYGNKIEAVTNLKNLQELYISGCKLTDISMLGDMKGLTKLLVYDNQLTNIPYMPNTYIESYMNFIPQSNDMEAKQFYIGKGMEMEFNRGENFDAKIFNLLSSARYYNYTGEEFREDINLYHEFEFIVNGEIVSPQELTKMRPGEHSVQVKIVGADIKNTAAIAKNPIKVRIVGEDDPVIGRPDSNDPVVNKPVDEELKKLPYTGGTASMATMLLGSSLIGVGVAVGKKRKKK